jgi:hypothetical protein
VYLIRLPSEEGGDFQLILVYGQVFVTHGATQLPPAVFTLSIPPQKGGDIQIILTAGAMDNSQVGFRSRIYFADPSCNDSNSQFVSGALVQYRTPNDIGILMGFFLD